MSDRSLEHVVRPRTAGIGFDVVAVEDTAVQLCWSALPDGPHTLVVTGATGPPRHIEVRGGVGAGSLVIDGLDPSSDGEARLHVGGRPQVRRWRTLASPPGDEVFRFATISDLHLGRGDREYRGPFAQHGTGRGTPRRQLWCAGAAIDEALAWGARMLVVKGDVCEETTGEAWDQAAELLGSLPVPVLMLPGNHDTGTLREFAPEAGAADRGLHVTRGVEHHDVDGLRIVLADSTIDDSGWGTLARHADEVAQLAAEADGAVFVATHHHAQRFAVPLFWPHGIPGPDARRFAAAVHAANPASMASSGHTHRCRRREVAGLTWTEVAATNHFPATWAGYAVHEGGIRQVVRRIAEPRTLAWAESTRGVLGGTWALWSTGTIEDRCFTLRW